MTDQLTEEILTFWLNDFEAGLRMLYSSMNDEDKKLVFNVKFPFIRKQILYNKKVVERLKEKFREHSKNSHANESAIIPACWDCKLFQSILDGKEE